MRWTQLPEFSECPADWEVNLLKEKADFLAGQSPDSQYYNTSSDGVPFLQGNADFGAEHPVPIVFCTQPTKLCKAGDTLISVRAPVGEINRADQVYGLGRGPGAVHAVAIEPDYLFHAMSRWHLPLRRAAQGSTFDAITARQFRQLQCCIPSNQEERLLIADCCNRADIAIRMARLELQCAERTKIALLQQVFTSGLPGRHSQTNRAVVFRTPFSFPAGWSLEPLGKLLTLVDYGTNAPGNQERQGYPVIAIPQVVSSVITRGEWPYADVPDNEAQQLRLAAGDVLLIRTNGNADYIGKSTVISDILSQEHVIFASYLIRARAHAQRLLGPYLNFFLASPLGRRQCLASANTSAGNHNLGARSLRRMLIPLPSLEEQEMALTLIQASEHSIDAIKMRVGSLKRLKTSLLQNLLTGRDRLVEEAIGTDSRLARSESLSVAAE